MPVLRSKKKMYNPEEYEVFCGEEMKPFVALPLEEEGEEVKSLEPTEVFLATELPPAGPESAEAAILEPHKLRLWNKIGKIFRPA